MINTPSGRVWTRLRYFRDWLLEHSYASAFYRSDRWTVDDLSNRRRSLSDVFFFPEKRERA